VRRAATLLVALGLLAALAGSGAATPAHSCVQKDELRFRAADGTKLVGHRFGGKKPGAKPVVVLAHMSAGDLCVWAGYARSLARQGIWALPFDLRGHGFSEGAQDHSKAAADVIAAVRAVRKLGARRVVVAGASLGGIAAIVAAPRITPPLAGVASVSGPAAIAGELNARPAAPKLRVPTLFLVAAADQNGPYDFAAEARELHAATATREKRLLVVAGSLHGTFLVAGSPSARKLLTRFVRNPAGTVP
jgi:alpha-beta hydrolase superfamily lysophospholipase